jgi:hypothetical protein
MDNPHLHKGAASHIGSGAIRLTFARQSRFLPRKSVPRSLAMELRAQNLQSMLLFSITVITATTALLVATELYLMIR